MSLTQSEATAGRDRLSVNAEGLTKQSQRNGVRAPYKWDDLQETAKHRETMNIVRAASAYTVRYYEAGRWMAAVEENWVAEWFLWHSFRFRDNRNQSATQQVTNRPAPVGGGAGYGSVLL